MPIVRTIGFGVLAGGIVLLILGVGLIVLIDRRGDHRRPAAPSTPAPTEPPPPAVDTV